ncbi:MAG: hypothetical protein L0Y58_05705 [Verrucomicrobia subdivision 3 bacterium]|nr:hypothetical protein [Limisphaerales bacterium]
MTTQTLSPKAPPPRERTTKQRIDQVHHSIAKLSPPPPPQNRPLKTAAELIADRGQTRSVAEILKEGRDLASKIGLAHAVNHKVGQRTEDPGLREAQTIFFSLLTEPVKAALETARKAHCKYLDELVRLRDLLQPEIEAQRLEKLLSSSANAKELQAARDKLAILKGDEANKARTQARSIVAANVLPAFIRAVQTLVDMAEALVAERRNEIVEAGRRFFSQFGLARQATAISRRCDKLVDLFAMYRAQIEKEVRPPTTTLPPTRLTLKNVMDFFIDPKEGLNGEGLKGDLKG